MAAIRSNGDDLSTIHRDVVVCRSASRVLNFGCRVTLKLAVWRLGIIHRSVSAVSRLRTWRTRRCPLRFRMRQLLPSPYPPTSSLARLVDRQFGLARDDLAYGTNKEHGVEMVPLYAARIEDLGPSDFVKIDCAACRRRLLRSSAELRCSHMALLTTAFLARLGLEPRHRVLDLKDRVRCRGCGVRGRAVVSIKWERMPRR